MTDRYCTVRLFPALCSALPRTFYRPTLPTAYDRRVLLPHALPAPGRFGSRYLRAATLRRAGRYARYLPFTAAFFVAG